MKNLDDLLKHEILDLYSAETQLVEALPKMAEAANHPDLRRAFEMHLEETKGHVERLEQVAELLGFDTDEGEKCKGMEGLIKEGNKMIEEDADEEVRDAGLIGAAQRVEHYEIAGYGTASYYAQMLGKRDVVELLQETLDEEKMADEKLNSIAKDKVNALAMQ